MMSSTDRDRPRNIRFTPNINPYAHGSVLVEYGNTKIHVTATVEETVPPFLRDKGQGWVTGEYSMLPAATNSRGRRERSSLSGRTQEIQRLIGRSLRAAVDLKRIGERTVIIDCDVLVADGGTRTASVSGGFVALGLAIKKLISDGKLASNPLIEQIAAISVGISREGEIIADLDYQQDSNCQTDMNIVMTKGGRFIEIQGTAEGEPFDYQQLQNLLRSASRALETVFSEQDKVI